MVEEKRERRAIVTISLPPELLERLDAHRWPQRMTRSRAIKEALQGYLDPQEDMRQ